MTLFVHGTGAVSPAGWGVPALDQALTRGTPLAPTPISHPAHPTPHPARRVPPPVPRPAFLAHPRLRRSSPIAHYVAAAALEALESNPPPAAPGRLGILVCTMCGCVRYSTRFYAETLADPATASPLIFPETVFNAPLSHLAAFLVNGATHYTLLGDDGVFLLGLATAAHWLSQDRVDGCLVIGAEELDWTVTGAFRLFSRRVVPAEGAAAIYLRREPPPAGMPSLTSVTSPHLFTHGQPPVKAALSMRAELPDPTPNTLLVDGTQGAPRFDAAETATWQDWTGPRLSPKAILGNALSAAAGWQCVAAVRHLQRTAGTAALVSVVGCNQQAIGATFERS